LQDPGMTTILLGLPWLGYYVRFANSINLPPVVVGLEGSDSLRKKYGRERLITDDNMGREWELEVPIFWR